ncbi:ImmA/IrrE family metallo-endopeptidase [Brachymonas sp. M4Q-1]|uniref:ImmA/IrrE family metallo-endopeptidase n=1 Tax=Brachymonas sp. M4Q-1 TaxID=3416906 RepID=UPI003CF3A8BE
MSTRWSIKTDWAWLESGSPEERAGFAAIDITAYGTCLTEGHDRLLQSVRRAPFLSAYHLAEWLAWNWWRLRWEPWKASMEWRLSHEMTSIGSGYIWPHISVLSDGTDVTLCARPTPERQRTPYRYISDAVSVIPGTDFETEVDLFIETVLRRLKDCGVARTNLETVWQSVLEERQDAALYWRRKIEALLGEDPGEMDVNLLQHLLDESRQIGTSAIEEIAANRVEGQAVPDVGALLAHVRRVGTVARSGGRAHVDVCKVREADAQKTDVQKTPAWKIGADAAHALRAHLQLDPDRPVSNQVLTDCYGVPVSILDARADVPPMDLSLSFAETQGQDRVLLRSRWETGRRFELARLLGDSVVYVTREPMRPATRSSTYRQKVQRAFAAELLCPFRAVDDMLGADCSMENQQDVAHHFGVSALTVRSLLVSHGRMSRSEFDEGY